MPLKYLSNLLHFFILCFSTGVAFGHTPNDAEFSATNTTRPKIEFSNIFELDDYLDLAVIEGENGVLRRFHKLTFTWDGPNVIEEDATFSDYRLDVTFTSPSGQRYIVPGYFAADGNAAETSATGGSKWRCHFNALEIGEYTYEVSFRTGTNVAVGFDTTAGNPVSPIDGDTGSFTVEETNKSGIDFRSKGKLEYIGEHFMQWTTGEYYLKIGSNSPENLFEYIGFDDSNSSRTFPKHIPDWTPNDPVWQTDKGKGIIGAMNYLSSKGINSQYYVLHRKGEQASPWANPFQSYTTYDVSKMAQWQIVFDHMMEKGLMAHIVFSESTNQSYFEVFEPSGDPDFSDKRKIYFREIVARFGYLNAVTWNIGEENGWDRRNLEWTGEEARALTTQQQKNFSKYVDDLVYYEDLITVHNGHSTTTRIFDNLQGDNSFNGISMQGFFDVDRLNVERSKLSLEQYRNESARAGKKWVIYYDEGFSFDPFPEDPVFFRQNMLWSTLTSGGAGMEHFTTRETEADGNQIFYDITLEDLRYSEVAFTQMKHAYDFYIDNGIPFQDMYNQDELVSNGWIHGDEFQNYVIYLLPGDVEDATITVTGDYEVKWYNPRTGGALQDGTVTTLRTGQDLDLGEPPSEVTEDWVIYLKSTITAPVPVTSVAFSSEDYHLGIGIQSGLNAQVLPENATNKDLIWSSSDPSIVTVDGTGIINGVTEGTAVITVTTVDGGFTDEATVIVVENADSCVGEGSILVEKYDNIETRELEALLNDPNYPDNPSSTYEITEFEIPKSSLEDAYGLRVSGFICVPETGLYTFWISGDDQVQLSLSVDNQFKNARRIAWHDSFTDVQEWDKFPSQRSEEIVLYSGQSYYIEALLKEGVFGDHMAVGWRKPSDGPGNEPSELVPGNVLATRDAGRTAVTRVEINVPSAELRLGETLELTETVFPLSASDKSVVWSSDNPSIVSVDENGNITGLVAGTTSIKVTTVDGNFVAEAIITVIDESVIRVTGVRVTPENTNLVIGGTLVLETSVQPLDATNKEVIWSSADPSIVAVDASGELSGISFGTTVISVRTVDGDFVAQATVTVVENSQIKVVGIDLNVDSASIEVGETLILQAIIAPTNATNTAVTWASDDLDIVSVDANGEILGVAIGSALVHATTEDGNFVARSTITVTESIVAGVTGISINRESVEVELESTFTLIASVTPDNASNQEVIWRSEDDSIVTVNANGEIYGASLGTAIVSATTVDGDFVAIATVTVVEDSGGNSGRVAVTGINVDIDNLVLYERDIVQIVGTVSPENASNDFILWVPEDLSIVAVDENGNVIAYKVGETNITATTLDGGFSKTISVTVLPSNVVVYPNPTNDLINITGIDERIGVFIYDSSGVLVKSEFGGNPIYVGDLSTATYLIRLSTGDRIRFVKR